MSRNKTYLVTNPCLLPISFAQRITAAQLAYINKHVIVDHAYSSFAVVPYSQAQQRKLRQSPDYSKYRFAFEELLQIAG